MLVSLLHRHLKIIAIGNYKLRKAVKTNNNVEIFFTSQHCLSCDFYNTNKNTEIQHMNTAKCRMVASGDFFLFSRGHDSHFQ